MVQQNNVIVFDIDGTICGSPKAGETYLDVEPFPDMIQKLKEYKDNGYYIILSTARNMRTYEGNLGRINANTGKTLFKWLEKHDIPFDEIFFGKPWCGHNGFYVDDKSIRPDEFLKYSHEEINELLKAKI
ncbi:HAD hydrolase family protein [Flectobacillus rivi]|uniref:HAD hydrolase family protein n=1 Tax=Flectobacillus rivi TaxID=2984209 RepID=A0ABT6YX26_9BACT|nr:HAD hydrolase family protein [Flectobacillus rivi]MDI9873368.1 HAD hydrolase family protein [Flectobacillus rivi]